MKNKLYFLDSFRRLQKISKLNPTSLNKEDFSYLSGKVQKEEILTRFFTEHFRTPKWIEWADDNGLIDCIFKQNLKDDFKRHWLSHWFAFVYVKHDHLKALKIIEKHQNIISPNLWGYIEHVISSQQKLDFSGEILARWVNLLIKNHNKSDSLNELEQILIGCKIPEHSESALTIFRYLTEPHIKLGEVNLDTEKEKSYFSKRDEVKIIGDDYWMKEAWENVFAPNLSHFADRLIIMLSDSIEKSYTLLEPLRIISEGFDPLSYSRSAIEPDEQNHGRDDINFLIDTARDTIEWLLQHKIDNANAIIQLWGESNTNLLNRLAIHAVRLHPKRKGSTKLNWVIRKGWVYNHDFHHEIYMLTKGVYPDLEAKDKQKLIKIIEVGNPGFKIEDDDDERVNNYSIYKFLQWLSDSDPTCELASNAVKRVLKKYPNFKQGKYPSHTTWTESGWGYRSPMTVEEMENTNPTSDDFIKKLLIHKGSEFDEGGREGLLRTLQGCVNANFDWAWSLMNELKKRSEWKTDVWSYLYYGFYEYKKSNLSVDQWNQVLNFLLDNSEILKATNMDYRISDMVDRGLRTQDGKFLEECLDVTEKIAELLIKNWDLEEAERGEKKYQMRSWLNTAINRPGGTLAEYLLGGLGIRVNQMDAKKRKIPTKYIDLLTKIVKGRSYNANLAKVILASRLYWLYALDKDWAKANLLPLFDWDKNEKVAEKIWHGYIFWGKWTISLLPEIMPYYKQSFKRLNSKLFPDELRDVFSSHMCAIAMYGDIHPIKEEWLFEYFENADVSDRESWTRHLRNTLDGLSDDEISNQWNTWLMGYWELRIESQQIPLTQSELNEMLHWVLVLRPHFEEAFALLKKCDLIEITKKDLLYKIEEHPLNEENPELLAEFIEFVLSKFKKPSWHKKGLLDLINQFIELRVRKDLLLTICDHLLRLGVLEAAKLADEVESV